MAVGVKRCGRQHSAETGQPCAPQEVHQDCLGLIVRVVPDGDARRSNRRSHSGEVSVPGTAGCLLERNMPLTRQGRHIDSLNEGGQSPTASKRRNKGCVTVSIGTSRTVMQMGDLKLQIELAPQPDQHMQ